MKKTRKLLCIVIGILLLGVIAVAVTLGIFAARGYGITVGRCLVADNGAYMLIAEDAPIKMSDQSKNKDLFADLTTGEKILVLHGSIAESYPARTDAYGCIRIEDGDSNDISANVIEQLTELGWMHSEEAGNDYTPVSYSCGYASITLQLPEGWEYAVEEYTDDCYSFGIRFWPAGYADDTLALRYYTSLFAVCGTGLSQKQVTVGAHEARMGTYDGKEVWDFICFTDTPGDYAVWNTGADAWWDKYGAEAMHILETAVLGEGALPKEQAIAAAEEKCTVQYDEVRPTFDFQTGMWKVNFYKANTAGGDQTVFIGADGAVVDTVYGE